MLDRGIMLCATVHDAVLIESSARNIARDCRIAAECWSEASKVVLDGFRVEDRLCYLRNIRAGTSKRMAKKCGIACGN